MEVLNKHHLGDIGDRIPIGRSTPFGNPFPMESFRNDRELVVNLYAEFFLTQLANMTIHAKAVWALPRDKDLVCFCAPKLCHGDVIKAFLDETQGCKDLKEARRLWLRKHNYQFLPSREGRDHINIYSKSLTPLGVLTSNFAYTPFQHPKHGNFTSMEGYWFYIGTGVRHEELRKLHGARAKAFGGALVKVYRDDFENLIVEGIQCKVQQTPELERLLTENHLPFKHYYYYGTPDDCKVVREGNGLLEKTYTRISRELGQSYKVIVAGSRDIKDPKLVWQAIADSKFRISEIVEGAAKGVDTLGFYYGHINHIPVKTFGVTDAEWKASRGAGMQRNIKMGNYADKAIVCIKDNSKGSTQMANFMKSLGKEVFIVNC